MLAAIAVRGSELLEASLRDAAGQAPTAIAALGRLVEAYVGFARSHAGYVHVMLRPELFEPHKHPEAVHAGEGPIQLLTEVVQACQREGSAPAGDPTPLVGMIWALAVGIVTL